MISGGSQLLPLGNRTAIAQEILALDYRALTQDYMEVSVLDRASRKILWEGR